MGLRDIFRASQNVIESIQKIVTDNQEINKKLESAGGFISLIGIVIDIYSDIKERLKTPEERAFGLLIKVTFQSTQELLNDLKMKLPRDIQSKIDKKINKKEMIKRLLDPFLIHSDWDSYLPDHPAISGFKYEILSILKDSGCNYDLLNSFIMKFNINLEYNIEKDENIHIFYDWWTKENKYKRLKEYLEFVKSHRYYVMGLDNRPLFEYYIEQNALSTSVYTWTYSNKEFDSYNARKVRDILYNFLDEDKKWYLIIGASFGIGKSSMPTSHTSADPVPDVEDKAEDHKDPSPTAHPAANRVVGKDVEQGRIGKDNQPEERDEEAVECTVHPVRENPDQHESDSWREPGKQCEQTTHPSTLSLRPTV